MGKFIDLTGQRFGNWLVIKKEESKETRVYWLCECQCGSGVRKTVQSGNLRKGCSRGCNICTHGKRLRPYEFLYNRLVEYSAKVRKIECDLSYEDFIEFTNIHECFYCHYEVIWNKYNSAKGLAHHLDRKDNCLGYSMSNCVVCCTRCNRAKSAHFTFNEWYEMTECFRKRSSK